LKFFIDEDLPRSLAPLLIKAGYHATDIRDTTMRGAKDWQIAAHARNESLCLLTGDYDFADIRNYPPGEFSGIVVINAGKDATVQQITTLFQEFLEHASVISDLAGKLAIVEPGRIRVRKG